MTAGLRRALVAVVALACLQAGAAIGFVLDAERVIGAVAEVNGASGRATALRFEFDMRIGDSEVAAATGELVTHPTGLARLELRAGSGLVERHVLHGSTHAASRNGVILNRYRAFLPPLFLLQADSAVTLHAALAEFGVRSEAIALAPCGERNCFVLGDPDRMVAQRASGPAPAAIAPDEGSESGPPQSVAGFSTIWVDNESFDVWRIESSDGVRTTLGPTVASEGVRAPSWILIEEPGQAFVRFEIRRVTPVNAPAVAFGDSWLLAPAGPSEENGSDGPEPGADEPRVGPKKS